MNSATRQFIVVFRLIKGNSPQQQTSIHASDAGTARRLFEQQNPGTAISSVREVLGR